MKADITNHDTDGTKPLLSKGDLGFDDYPAGGDQGRVYVGSGTENIPLAKKSEVDDIADGTTQVPLKTINGASIHGIGNLSVGGTMAAPSITMTTTLNENAQVTGTLDNYDTNVTYYIGAVNGTINGNSGVQLITSNTFTYEAPDITNDMNGTDTVTAYYTFESSTSNPTTLPITVVWVDVVADDAVVFNMTQSDLDNAEYNNGWGVV